MNDRKIVQFGNPQRILMGSEAPELRNPETQPEAPPAGPASASASSSTSSSICSRAGEDSYTSRDTRAYAREGQEQLEADLRAIADAYALIGGRMPLTVARECLTAIDMGMEAAVIVLAIEEASKAPRPSWAYASRIIERCIEDGALDEYGYAMRKAKHRSDVSQANRLRHPEWYAGYDIIEELFGK